MTIKSLSLENCQGIQSLTLDFNGESAAIFGANEAGKTTVFNAITWLLFGQASTGASNFTPKTIDENGEVHGLNHGVTAVFICPDGSELILARIYHEVYTKKRGTANEVFSGHTTEYYVDGVPVAEKSYTDTLLRMFGSIETMRLLTMPDYFPSRYDWKERRKLLLDICGDVADVNVLNAFPDEFRDISKILKKPGNTFQFYAVDEYRAIAQRQMQDINRELQGIPARIDEATKAMPVLDGTAETYEACKAESDRLRLRVAELEAARRNTTENSMREGAKQKLLAAQNKLEAARNSHEKSLREENAMVLDRIDRAKMRISELGTEMRNLEADLAHSTRVINDLTMQRNALASEYEQVQQRSYSGDSVCPVCGQAIPEDRIRKAVADFNLAKSRELESLNARGRQSCSKEMIADATAKSEQIAARIASIKDALVLADHELHRAEEAVPQTTPFEQLPVYGRLTADIRECESQLRGADALVSGFIAGASAEIKETTDELNAVMSKLLSYQQLEKQQARINELQDRENDLAKKYEDLERGIALCEAFVRSKVSMLTERINSRFSSVRFILFDEQINGGLKECCEVAVPASDGSLIPFAFANTAAKLNAGLEIIGVLAQHFGASLPVVVDNAESVTEIRASGIEQLIKLIVSPEDKQLRMVAETIKKGELQWGA